MLNINDYLRRAEEYEEVFRNVLRDIKSNRNTRPLGCLVPEDIATEIPLEELYAKYSAGERYGVFSICDFYIDGNTAHFSFQNTAMLSGSGTTLRYKIKEDNIVEYSSSYATFMS